MNVTADTLKMTHQIATLNLGEDIVFGGLRGAISYY